MRQACSKADIYTHMLGRVKTSSEVSDLCDLGVLVTSVPAESRLAWLMWRNVTGVSTEHSEHSDDSEKVDSLEFVRSSDLSSYVSWQLRTSSSILSVLSSVSRPMYLMEDVLSLSRVSDPVRDRSLQESISSLRDRLDVLCVFLWAEAAAFSICKRNTNKMTCKITASLLHSHDGTVVRKFKKTKCMMQN